MSRKLSSNMEMYLKTILRLGAKDKPVRVKEIADSLRITMPSVSEALGTLKEKGLVLHPSYGEVKLSARGRRVAKGVNERFEALRRFLTEVLRVEEGLAKREACEIEHVVGKDTSQRLTAFLDYITHCEKDVGEAISHFHEYLGYRMAGESCPQCEVVTDESTRN
jgi:DtxR family Mn-dependent transcriptional regulator